MPVRLGGIIGMHRKNEYFVERLPMLPDRPWLACGLTLLFCLAALGVRLLAAPVLSPGYPYVTFFPAVILPCFLFGIRPGIFAALLCGVLAWYFFIPPERTFHFDADTGIALVFYAIVCTIDIALVHWMQRANYKLAVERERSDALAENREMLFRELQHRVSNNIQVVAALISLQRRNVGDESARKALDEASRRLAVIGRISRALYDPDGQRIGVRAFIDALADDILEAAGRRDVALDMAVDEDIAFHPDAAVPLSLVIAETISNALEHGFAGGRSGRISLSLSRPAGDRLLLEVADDGLGLPEGFSLEDADSLGLRIATALAQQLGGTFALHSGETRGTTARLDIPA